MRPLWAEVSLPNLQHNFREIRKHVGPGTQICAVTKAHAYGHGAVECSHALEAEGAQWFGVTSTEEGATVRDAGARARVLLMSGFWRDEEDDVVRRDLTPAVWEPWHLEALEKAAARAGRREFPVHIKVDTGMGRLGVQLPNLERLLDALGKTAHLRLEGVMSHLASAEVLDAPDVETQAQNFERAKKIVLSRGFTPAMWHLANTSAMVGRSELRMDMVRPGLALYGYTLPFVRQEAKNSVWPYFDLKPVLSWKTRILSIAQHPAGQAIGYGGTYVTQAPARIAVLPIGYADGLNRHLSSRARFIVRDTYAPVVGRVSMDLTAIDITHVPAAALGDEVIVIGASEHCAVTAWDHACHANTVAYEVLCNIGKRVPRKYVH
ncbi:MAG TPA: alanine racemase [Terriglobales bacterium]|nr:alanine racemase [Terriglobales bacterium]